MRFVQAAVEFVLAQEARELDLIGDFQFPAQGAQFRLLRSLPGNGEPRGGIVPREPGKRAQARRQALLRDEAACLEQAESAVGRIGAPLIRKSVEWNTRAVEPQFSAGTTQARQGVEQGMGAREDQADLAEKLLHGAPVGGVDEFHEHVRAVERHHGGKRGPACRQVRQELHARVAEENMQDGTAAPLQSPAQTPDLVPAKLERPAKNLACHNPLQPPPWAARHQRHVIEGKAGSVLPLLRKDRHLEMPDGS